MQMHLRAAIAGQVETVGIKPGDQVGKDSLLLLVGAKHPQDVKPITS